MELETILKTDEFKKVLREVVREQMNQTFQDMEEIRRSPAGSIIRIEEEIKSINQTIVTKEDFKSLEGRIFALEGRFEGLEGRFERLESRFEGLEGRFERLEGRFEGLEGRFERFEGRFEGLEGRFKGLEGRINLLTGLIFVMLTLYGALVVKLIFFP